RLRTAASGAPKVKPRQRDSGVRLELGQHLLGCKRETLKPGLIPTGVRSNTPRAHNPSGQKSGQPAELSQPYRRLSRTGIDQPEVAPKQQQTLPRARRSM